MKMLIFTLSNCAWIGGVKLLNMPNIQLLDTLVFCSIVAIGGLASVVMGKELISDKVEDEIANDR